MEKKLLHDRNGNTQVWVNAEVYGCAKVCDNVPQVYGYAVVRSKTSVQS